MERNTAPLPRGVLALGRCENVTGYGVKTNMRNALSLTFGAAILAASSLAGAQDVNVSTTAAQPSTTTVTGGSVTDTSGPTDHSVVTGHLALRYFGTTPAGRLAGTSMPTAGGSFPLHTVGVRYWLNGGLGIEGGLSFGISSASATETTVAGSTTRTVSSDDPNAIGFGLHFGLPIQIAEAKHISIQLSPYLGLTYAHSAIQWSPNPTAMTPDLVNSSLNWFRLEVGARLQAELQFGFLGAPQLGLIAQFGLGLGYTSSSKTDDYLPSRTQDSRQVTSSRGEFGLGTTIGNYSLSDIITGSVSAVWYFGGSPTR